MNIIKKFLTGSRYYFDGMEGFNPHDTDYIVIVDFSKKIFDHKHKDDVCHFYYRNTSVKNIISYITATNGKMLCASLLIKDFAEYIGLTITELKTNETLKILFETMPPKWQYINCVYKLYIENNGFYLTDEQRKYVYEIYLKERNN